MAGRGGGGGGGGGRIQIKEERAGENARVCERGWEYRGPYGRERKDRDNREGKKDALYVRLIAVEK